MRSVKILAVLVLFASAGVAQAEWIPFDVAPNNVLPGPALVSDIGQVNARFPTCGVASDVGLGSLAAGGADVDFYSVSLPAGCIVTAITTPFSTPFSNPDTTLGAFAPGGGLPIIVNDDDSTTNVPLPNQPNRGSAIRFITSVGGLYSFVVSGFSDGLGADVFDGLVGGVGHGEVGNYALTISVFPEPGTIALLASGLILIARRRRLKTY